MVTSSAVTKRIDRLERAGLVTRTVSPDDARSRRVRLTGAGVELVDRLMGRHIANEHRLVSGLSDRDRAQLAAILRRWGQSLESGSSA
jgi:DNA-binding MarR family transcriptional regulator